MGIPFWGGVVKGSEVTHGLQRSPSSFLLGVISNFGVHIYPGIDPKRGFADMKRIRIVHGNDAAIVQKMVFLATREEVLVNEALGSIPLYILLSYIFVLRDYRNEGIGEHAEERGAVYAGHVEFASRTAANAGKPPLYF